MPCNSDYLNATGFEKSLSKVACLLDELEGKPINPSHWSGYHPRVYGSYSQGIGDIMVAELCSKLKKLDVSKLSLEMQIWWRDHQKADKAREAEEKEAERKSKLIQSAVNKLTPEEFKALEL